jgi:predicted NUDIX family NTP pyrophosphohydrolase
VDQQKQMRAGEVTFTEDDPEAKRNKLPREIGLAVTGPGAAVKRAQTLAQALRDFKVERMFR